MELGEAAVPIGQVDLRLADKVIEFDLTWCPPAHIF